MGSEVHQVSGWRTVLLLPLGLLIRLWCRTLRIRFEPEVRERFRKASRGTVIALWHNHLFTSTELHRRFRSHRPVGGMVSASRDGAWLAALFRTVGIRAVRGSEGGRSFAATREAIRFVVEGGDLAVTPDGSRGPLHRFKPGALFIARESGSDLVLVGFAYSRRHQLKSWDRFNLPLPFSTLVLAVDWIANHDLPPGGSDGIEALRQRLRACDQRAAEGFGNPKPGAE